MQSSRGGCYLHVVRVRAYFTIERKSCMEERGSKESETFETRHVEKKNCRQIKSVHFLSHLFVTHRDVSNEDAQYVCFYGALWEIIPKLSCYQDCRRQKSRSIAHTTYSLYHVYVKISFKM